MHHEAGEEEWQQQQQQQAAVAVAARAKLARARGKLRDLLAREFPSADGQAEALGLTGTAAGAALVEAQQARMEARAEEHAKHPK